MVCPGTSLTASPYAKASHPLLVIVSLKAWMLSPPQCWAAGLPSPVKRISKSSPSVAAAGTIAGTGSFRLLADYPGEIQSTYALDGELHSGWVLLVSTALGLVVGFKRHYARSLRRQLDMYI